MVSYRLLIDSCGSQIRLTSSLHFLCFSYLSRQGNTINRSRPDELEAFSNLLPTSRRLACQLSFAPYQQVPRRRCAQPELGFCLLQDANSNPKERKEERRQKQRNKGAPEHVQSHSGQPVQLRRRSQSCRPTKQVQRRPAQSTASNLSRVAADLLASRRSLSGRIDRPIGVWLFCFCYLGAPCTSD